MFLLITFEALDLRDVFLFFFNDVGVSTYCKKAMVTTFLAPLMLRTSLVILVFLTNLALVGGKLLVFATRYVSKRSVSRLSLSKVFVFLFYRSVLLEILQINLLGL